MGVALVMKNPARVSAAIDANPMSPISEVRSMAHSRDTQPRRNYAGRSTECRVKIRVVCEFGIESLKTLMIETMARANSLTDVVLGERAAIPKVTRRQPKINALHKP